MIYIILACVAGALGGFGLPAQGELLRRKAGTVILSLIFGAELGFSVGAGCSYGVWWGIGTFIVAAIVCGKVGGFIYRATYRRR